MFGERYRCVSERSFETRYCLLSVFTSGEPRGSTPSKLIVRHVSLIVSC